MKKIIGGENQKALEALYCVSLLIAICGAVKLIEETLVKFLLTNIMIVDNT